MIANLPMYQRAELVEAHDEFWGLIRNNLRSAGLEAPDTLTQNAGEMEAWTAPDLFFSQTCGMPYRNFLHDKVTLIGTPDYGIEGCPAGYYCSGYVVHKSGSDNLSDYKSKLFAYNDENSQSGFYVTKGYFENRICSGSHINSAKMVANGKANIAAIDAVSLKLIQRYDDFATELKVIKWTKPTPALPFIAYKNADQKIFFDAINQAINSLPSSTRSKLMINDIVFINDRDYLI